MDTRYWGPSGWRLLHLIVHAHSARPAAAAPLQRFFSTLPFVLPCKYCRAHLTEHYRSHPIPAAAAEFPRWLWRVHNAVNAGLRAQGLPCVTEDPPFQAVQKVYGGRLSAGCTRTTFEGWEFLFSVAETHPLSAAGRTSTPMPYAPATGEGLCVAEKNRCNLMTPEERLPFYVEFWRALPAVLPFKEWAQGTKWSSVANAAAESRAETTRTLYAVRCDLEERLQLLNRTTYASLCKELRSFKSGCGTSTRGKTCRLKKRGPQ